jgi:hypothetical protein
MEPTSLLRPSEGVLKGISSTSPIRVLYHAALNNQRLLEYTRPARELEPESEATNNVADLIVQAGRQLAESRRNPVHAPSEKMPTRGPGGIEPAE